MACSVDIPQPNLETHYGPLPLTKDPSQLGHSAAKINQKRPAKLSKVDYYPALYGAYTILDARILDRWRYRGTMEKMRRLPC